MGDPIDFSSVGGQAVKPIDFSSIGGQPVSAPAPDKEGLFHSFMSSLGNVNPMAVLRRAAFMGFDPVETVNSAASLMHVPEKLKEMKQDWSNIRTPSSSMGDKFNSAMNLVEDVTPVPSSQGLRNPGRKAVAQVQSGDIPGAIGTTAGTIVNQAVPLIVGKLSTMSTSPGKAQPGVNPIRDNPITNTFLGRNPNTIDPETAFKVAAKPRNSVQNVDEHIERGLPDARRALDNLGIDPKQMTLNDAETAIKQAKKDVYGEIEHNVLGPNKNYTVDATPVARKIAQVGQDMTDIQARRMPDTVQEIASNAKDYAGRLMDFGTIEDRIQELNNQLRSQQATFGVKEGELRNDPKFAHQFAELDGLRELQRTSFEKMADTPGGADYLKDLKQRYGSLKVLQDIVDRRINVAQRQGLSGSLYETGGRIAGMGDLIKGALARDVSTIGSGLIKMQAGKNAALLNDPTFLMQKAFSGTEPTGPAPNIGSKGQPANVTPGNNPQRLYLHPGQYEQPSSPLRPPLQLPASSASEPIPLGPSTAAEGMTPSEVTQWLKQRNAMPPFPGSKAAMEQGGHAGGGVSSVEELSRPGKNYIIGKNNSVTYHGKSFAPEDTPAGGVHVTVLPDGKFRVNAGTLSEAQKLALKKALK